jgi:hypothetical protein
VKPVVQFIVSFVGNKSHCYERQSSDRLHVTSGTCRIFFHSLITTHASLMANQKDNVGQPFGSETSAESPNRRLSSLSEHIDEHGECRKRKSKLPTIADESGDEDDDGPPSKLNRDSPSPIIKMADMRYYKDAKRMSNTEKSITLRDADKDNVTNQQRGNAIRLDISNSANAPVQAHDERQRSSDKSTMNDDQQAGSIQLASVTYTHAATTTSADSDVIQRSDDRNNLANVAHTSATATHDLPAATDFNEQQREQANRPQSTMEDLRKQLADQKFLIDQLRKLKSADFHQQLDMQLPDVENWLTQLSMQLRTDISDSPDVFRPHVADTFMPHTLTYVDTMPDELLAKRVSSLLQARDEALQNICKWQSVPPKLALLQQWAIYPRFSQRTNFSNTVQLLESQLERTYVTLVTEHFIHSFRSIQQEIDTVMCKRPDCIRMLRENQFDVIAAKQKKTRIRFQQVTAPPKRTSANSNMNMRKQQSTSSKLPASSLQTDGQPSTSRADGNAQQHAIADVAVSHRDQQVAMDTSTTFALEHNTQRNLAPWPPNLRTWHRRNTSTNANDRQHGNAPRFDRARNYEHSYYNNHSAHGQQSRAQHTGRPGFGNQHYSGYGEFRHGPSRTNSLQSWQGANYRGHRHSGSSNYHHTWNRYNARIYSARYIPDTISHYGSDHHRGSEYPSGYENRTHTATARSYYNYDSPDAPWHYDTTHYEHIPPIGNYRQYGGYSR